MKIITRIVCYLTLFFLFGCGELFNIKWKEIQTKEMQGNPKGTGYLFNDFLLISEKEGFLAGLFSEHSEPDSVYEDFLHQRISRKQDAVVFKTTNGGVHWEKIQLGEGSVQDLVFTGDTLIALKHSYSSDVPGKTISHIYLSEDRGDTWRKTGDIKKNIRAIRFWNATEGIGFDYSTLESRSAVLFTQDAGMHWQALTFKHAKKSGIYTTDSNGYIYWVSGANSYVRFDTRTFSEKRLLLPNDINEAYSLMVDNNDNLYVITEDKEKRVVLYKRIHDDKYEKIMFPIKDSLIESIYIYDNVISVLVSSRLNFSKTNYYRSENSGYSWKKEKTPLFSSREIAFFGKNIIWVRTAPGVMLVRE